MKYEGPITQFAETIRVMGHPVRIGILRLLSAAGTAGLTVKEIHEQLHISQPEASKHLITMKNRSILFCDRRAGRAFYRVNGGLPFLRGIIRYLEQK